MPQATVKHIFRDNQGRAIATMRTSEGELIRFEPNDLVVGTFGELRTGDKLYFSRDDGQLSVRTTPPPTPRETLDFTPQAANFETLDVVDNDAD
jgi:hypothetical protein